ncbi:UTP--glucose-1-phosphate uridylyltransferase [Candidatus Microgenomates bacterium CPR3]|nr:UTP--glucose-1-phosphate uridylyltransferase [Candidatus Microgenomates bacterium CPR3]
MSFQKVRKAVIPAAGFGTRFLPQTKAMPKEMLPIVDKPVIQYIVEELVDAGIEDIIIVTGYHKRTIEDHFDNPSTDLIENLKMGGEKKKPLLDSVMKISSMANFAFIAAEPSRFKQLLAAYEKYGYSCMASVRAKSDADYDRYGFAAGNEIEPGVIDCTTIIEKPGKANAPSDLANVSGFLFTPDIFEYLDAVLANLQDGDEFYYNDALKLMLKDGKHVLATEIKNGKYYDTGNKLEYMKTQIEFALKDPSMSGDLKEFIKGLQI